jgi:antitoxin component YwqK of YwqJK toxin-antitoxin module
MMKKAILLLAVVFSIHTYAQDIKPTFEKDGKMIKATYFHDNGEIAQTGHLLDGKLHGEWFMYDVEGKKIVYGKYVNGERAGKWFFWKNDVLKEVDFQDNKIAAVKDWNDSQIVSLDK